MSKKVDIEYCGAWGYGGPAMKLKQFLLSNYTAPLEINLHSANGTTGTIKVSWIKNGALQTVWEEGRQDTINGHQQILGLLKQHEWSGHNVEGSSINEGDFWNLGSPWRRVMIGFNKYLILFWWCDCVCWRWLFVGRDIDMFIRWVW